MNAKTIVLTGGGTAGHVMPNLAILPLLKIHFTDIHYIGSETGIERELADKAGLAYHAVTTVKLRRKFTLANLKIPALLCRGVREAKKILEKLRPAVVFSKGGFVSVPVVTAAKKLGIPVVLHESDYTPGLANKLSAGKACSVCTSFSDTARRFCERGVHTGTPIRAELLAGSAARGRHLLHLSAAKPVILIMGGSQGSAAINAAVRSCLDKLEQKYSIIHLTGKGNALPELERAGYRQIEFTTDLADILAASDIVLSRAGSNAINEFLTLAKPMLLIPLPRGESRGDQIVNAAYFEKLGYARVLREEEITGDILYQRINEVYLNRLQYQKNMSASTSSSGAENVVREILKAARSQ